MLSAPASETSGLQIRRQHICAELCFPVCGDLLEQPQEIHPALHRTLNCFARYSGTCPNVGSASLFLDFPMLYRLTVSSICPRPYSFIYAFSVSCLPPGTPRPCLPGRDLVLYISAQVQPLLGSLPHFLRGLWATSSVVQDILYSFG